AKRMPEYAKRLLDSATSSDNSANSSGLADCTPASSRKSPAPSPSPSPSPSPENIPSSSAPPNDPSGDLLGDQSPPADLKARQAQRLAQVTDDAIETFNASPLVKPNGGMLASVNAKVGRE